MVAILGRLRQWVSGVAAPLLPMAAFVYRPVAGILGRHGVLVGVLLLAFVARFWALERVPGNLMCDECDNLREIYEIIKLGEPPFFGLDWKPQAAFSQHVAAFFVRWLGDDPAPYLRQLEEPGADVDAVRAQWRSDLADLDDLYALRVNPALVSFVFLVPFYLLMRRTLSRAAAASAVLLLAFNPWYLNFSRSGWENVHICLATVMAVLGMVRVMERRGHWLGNVALCGLGMAWGMYGYFSGKAVPLIIALSGAVLLLLFPIGGPQPKGPARWLGGGMWLLFWGLVAGPLLVIGPVWLLFHTRPVGFQVTVCVIGILALWAATLPGYEPLSRRLWAGAGARPLYVFGAYAAAALLALVLFWPQSRVMRERWEHSVSRMRTVSALHVQLPYEQFTTRADLLRYYAWQTIQSPLLPINNTRRYAPPNEPFLHPVCGFLLIVGLIVGAMHFGRHFWWWLMLIVPFVTTQVITTRSPHAARGLALVPVLFYFVALGIDQFPSLWYGFRQRRWPILLVLLVGFVTWQEYRLYVDWITHPHTLRDRGPSVTFEEFPYWAQWQHLRLAGGTRTANNDTWGAQGPEIMRQLGAAQPVQTAPAQAPPTTTILDEPPAPPVSTPPPGMEPYPIHEMLHNYADANPAIKGEPEGRAFDGRPDEDVLLLYYAQPDWTSRVTNRGWTTDLSLRAVPEREVGMEWRATLNVPQDGVYEFALLTDDGGDVFLDGKPLLEDPHPHAARTVLNRVPLAAGPHALRVRYFQKGGAFSMVLFWCPPGRGWEPIPADALSAPAPGER